jgi:hypothetical protein
LINANSAIADFILATGLPAAIFRVAVQVDSTNFAGRTLYVDAVIRHTFSVQTNLVEPAAFNTAIKIKAFSIGANLARGALHADAIMANAFIVVTNIRRVTSEPATVDWETIPAGAGFANRALYPDTVCINAVIFETNLAIVRTLFGGTIIWIAPAVGATIALLALDIDTAAALAYAVDANFAFTETWGIY